MTDLDIWPSWQDGAGVDALLWSWADTNITSWTWHPSELHWDICFPGFHSTEYELHHDVSLGSITRNPCFPERTLYFCSQLTGAPSAEAGPWSLVITTQITTLTWRSVWLVAEKIIGSSCSSVLCEVPVGKRRELPGDFGWDDDISCFVKNIPWVLRSTLHQGLKETYWHALEVCHRRAYWSGKTYSSKILLSWE